MNFEDLYNNFEQLDLDAMVVESVIKNESEIIDLNTEQLNKGFLSTGKKTDKYASKEYENYKKAIGKGESAPFMNLNLEGDFHSGFFIKEVNKKFIEFNSKDEKTNELEKRYSPDIFGLNEENKAEASQIILPDLQNSLIKELTK